MERPCKRRRKRKGKRKRKGMDTSSSSWEKEDKRGGREAFSFLREGGKAVLWSGGRENPQSASANDDPSLPLLLLFAAGQTRRERSREREREREREVP